MAEEGNRSVTILEWIDKARTECLADALEFLRLQGLCSTPEEMDALAAEWPQYVRTCFDKNKPDAFYAQWTGPMGGSNVPTNIRDQFTRDYVVAALFLVFGPSSTYGGKLLDFGCGTAAISLSWQRAFAPRIRLFLADVENLPREYVKYRIEKNADTNVRLVDVGLADVADNGLDVILCIDVLEHLRHPSETFRMLDGKLRCGGILIAQAPWGNHHEHLDCAPIDWQNNGGREILENGYVRMAQMNRAIELSGVYWKRLNA